MTVRVIDIETTGINPVADAIIEIASVDVLADGTIANRQEALVCPNIIGIDIVRTAECYVYTEPVRLLGGAGLIYDAVGRADRRSRCRRRPPPSTISPMRT